MVDGRVDRHDSCPGCLGSLHLVTYVSALLRAHVSARWSAWQIGPGRGRANRAAENLTNKKVVERKSKKPMIDRMNVGFGRGALSRSSTSASPVISKSALVRLHAAERDGRVLRRIEVRPLTVGGGPQRYHRHPSTKRKRDMDPSRVDPIRVAEVLVGAATVGGVATDEQLAVVGALVDGFLDAKVDVASVVPVEPYGFDPAEFGSLEEESRRMVGNMVAMITLCRDPLTIAQIDRADAYAKVLGHGGPEIHVGRVCSRRARRRGTGISKRASPPRIPRRGTAPSRDPRTACQPT